MKALTKTRLFGVLVTLALVVHAQVAFADIFLSLGSSIAGDATRKGFEKQLPVTSYSFAVSMPTPDGMTRNSITLRPLVVSRPIDRASPLVMQAANTATSMSKVVLTLVTTGDQTASAAPLVIELTNAVVRDYQATGSTSSTGLGTEQFTLEYTAIKMTVASVDSSGRVSSPVTGSVSK